MITASDASKLIQLSVANKNTDIKTAKIGITGPKGTI